MRILLVGKGGREHALAWKLSQSPRVQQIYVVPGNGGTARGLHKASNIDDTKDDDYPALVALAKKLLIDLVVVGPDQAVVNGIESYFREAGIPCFAPTKEAAQLEGSKTFAKDFMQRHGIPTAAYCSFDKYGLARDYLQTVSYPVVIKVSGLAAGKGVIIAAEKSEAEEALENIMVKAVFGPAGSTVVIEEYLIGEEISVLTFSDGQTTKTLPPGQDHKRIFEGDKGPNTGGMGVYAPVPVATPAVMDEIERKVLRPTFEGLKSDGLTYAGMLFTGIMLTASGPKVLEYNARFGDPETESVLLLLSEQTNLADIMMACTEGRLDQVEITVSPRYACNLIVAAGGYPEAYATGDLIEFGPTPDGVIVFHAGTKLVDGQISTAGGRVLSVAATGETLQEAVEKAYEGVRSAKFKDMFYRRDIAHRRVPARLSGWENNQH